MTNTNPAGELAYELALLQFRPDVTSEELLNIGVVAFSPGTQQLICRTTDRYSRVKAVYPALDGLAFRALSRAIRARSRSVEQEFKKFQATFWQEGMVVGDDQPWDGRQHIEPLLDRIVTRGSSNFAWSSIRYGVCVDLKARVDEVYEEYIGRAEVTHTRERIDADDVWRYVAENPKVKPILAHIEKPVQLATDHYSHTFRASWMNGHLQVLESISLDFVKSTDMEEVALRWNGIVEVLGAEHDFRLTALVTDRPHGPAGEKYDEATLLLKRSKRIRKVIPMSDAQMLGKLVTEDLAGHAASSAGDYSLRKASIG